MSCVDQIIQKKKKKKKERKKEKRKKKMVSLRDRFAQVGKKARLGVVCIVVRWVAGVLIIG